MEILLIPEMEILLMPDLATKRYGVRQTGYRLEVLSWCCGALVVEADPDEDEDTDMFCLGCEQRFSAIPVGDTHWLPAIRIGRRRQVETWIKAWAGDGVEVDIT